ncbi:MAG: hypothetical protein WCS77_09000 [Elusimicrobiaceae bacterium]|jgi:hypothetical protein
MTLKYLLCASLLFTSGCFYAGNKTGQGNAGVSFRGNYMNYQTVLEWTKYEKPNFSAYRIVRSSEDRRPACSDGKTVYSSYDADRTGYVDSTALNGEFYYRLCVDLKDAPSIESPVVRIFVKGDPFGHGVQSGTQF